MTVICDTEDCGMPAHAKVRVRTAMSDATETEHEVDLCIQCLADFQELANEINAGVTRAYLEEERLSDWQYNFDRDLLPLILSGSKSCTWRVADEREVRVGNRLRLMCDGVEFAQATVAAIVESTLAWLVANNIGHESYADIHHACRVMSGYYGKPIEPHTHVRAVHWAALVRPS